MIVKNYTLHANPWKYGALNSSDGAKHDHGMMTTKAGYKYEVDQSNNS